MENLPVEILDKEIGSYLDIPSMISMSFINKDFQNIYQAQFQKLIHDMDPYIINGSVNDFLNITKVGTLDNTIYKVWRLIFQTIIKELEYLYPYVSRKSIVEIFYNVVPLDAVDGIKNHIKNFLTKTNIFIFYRNVLYRNPLSGGCIELSDTFETDINDMIDTLLNEIAMTDRSISRDNSMESITDDSAEDVIDYFPYENVTDAIENWVKYL